MSTLHRAFFVAGVLFFACALWCPQPQMAQAPGQAGSVIRAEARLVLVDAVVTDKKGGYVRDLQQKDFRVWEDNKEQAIKSFSFGADPAAPAESQKRYLVLFFDNSSMDFTDQTRARQAAAQFVAANAGANRMMAVANFGGGLQIAQNFTDDAERLKAIVTGVKFSSVSTVQTASAGMPPIRQTEMDFGARNMILALRSLARNLGKIPGRKTVVLLTAGFAVSPERMSEVTAAVDACNKANVAVYPIDVRGLVAPGTTTAPGGLATPGIRPVSQSLDSAPDAAGARQSSSRRSGLSSALMGVVRLASFHPAAPGLVAPSGFAMGQRPGGGGAPPGGGGGRPGGGAPGPPSGGAGGGRPGGGGTPPPAGGAGGRPGGTPGTPGTPGAGGRGGNPGGNVPRGPNPYGPGSVMYPRNPMEQPRVLIPEPPQSTSTNQQIMYMLANGTGGFVIQSTNDLVAGLQKIGSEQSEFYILGYTPPQSEEGSCHALKVKVDRGGTIVRARSGYCNVRSHDMLAGSPVEKQLETHAAASQPGAIAASIQAPFFYTQPNVARVAVAMEIPTASMQFEKQKGKFHGALNVLGIAYTPQGSVGARFSDSVKLDFENKKEVEAFKERAFHYENQFDVASGEYNLKVAFNTGGEQFGRVEAPLVVEPYDGQGFSMSGIAFSNEVHRATDMGAGLDAALIEDRTPLVTQGIQVVPSGTNRLRKGAPGFIYFEVYEPALAMSGVVPPNLVVGVQVRIIDAKTGQAKFNSGMGRIPIPETGGNPVIPAGQRLPMDQLDAGSYNLELTSADNQGRSTKRAVPFVVE